VLALSALLAGCDYRLTASDRCSDEGRGALHVIVRPDQYGSDGWGEIVFVGDTLPLVAELRPVIGSSVDVWGSGGCTPDYGELLPATFEWSSADQRIATVTSSGVVRGVAEGIARVTARDRERGLSGGLDIHVWVRAGG
jgi:hypothetical protein